MEGGWSKPIQPEVESQSDETFEDKVSRQSITVEPSTKID